MLAESTSIPTFPVFSTCTQEGGLIKPNYNSVDLAEVELVDTGEIITVSDIYTKW